MKNKNLIMVAAVALAALTACKDNYLGGLIQVGTHDANDAEAQRYKAERLYLEEGKRPSYWGECEYWKEFTISSSNDVDTAFNKLYRKQVVDTETIPQGNDSSLNQKIIDNWSEPEINPGLSYIMKPRWGIVTARGFEQRGLVSYRISKNNQQSYIDIAYCVGGTYKLGFYIPHTIADQFEPDLKAKFEAALNQLE